jgi:hypothetical protein
MQRCSRCKQRSPGALAAVMNMVMAGPAVESSHPAVMLSGTPLHAMPPAALQALMSVTRFFAIGATSSVQRTAARSMAARHLQCRATPLGHLIAGIDVKDDVSVMANAADGCHIDWPPQQLHAGQGSRMLACS